MNLNTNWFKCLVTLILALCPGFALADSSYWPGARMDKSIPSLAAVVGHEHGTQISSPEQLVKYLTSLAEAAPAQTRLVEYARSWEGRPLVYLVIGSADNIARLDDIKRGMQQLADPRTLQDQQRRQLVDSLPAIAWFSFGVHGNEISSGDAALVLARHLLGAHDKTMSEILSNTVIVIDPAQNPDGRGRFVAHYQQHAGLEPAVSAIAAERREAWPGGRANHYLFDMNRDWFALTQPESRGRVKSLLEYYPLVHADVHEMGTNSSYYFPPPARPFNPHITSAQKAGIDELGKSMAMQFDRFGFDYFTREVYDALYPGYGDSWPTFHGSLGMTFEMASARGLAGERDDGSIVTYRDGVHRHFVASMGTLIAVSRNREKLLKQFVDFRQEALADKHVYAIPLIENDSSLVQLLGEKLQFQGVDVEQLQEKAKICGRNLTPGSLLIRAGQPAGRLVRTLLDAESPLMQDFLEEQERRRRKGLQVELYDVLGWSLPAAFNLDMASCEASARTKTLPFRAEPLFQPPPEATLAYLVPWGDDSAARFLAAALRKKLLIHTSTLAFSQTGVFFSPGTLIIKVRENEPGLHSEISALAIKTGAQVVAAASSWTDTGSNFGSANVRRIRAPRIALAWDEPTRSLSAGATRFLLERRFGYPVTPVRTDHILDSALDNFDVLILPDGGNYGGSLSGDGLADWVRRGGTLVGIAGALRYLSDADLLSSKREYKLGLDDPEAVDDKKDEDKTGLVEGTAISSVDDYLDEIKPIKGGPDTIPGVLLQGLTDRDHWLTAGLPATQNFVITGSDVYQPLNIDVGTNAVRFASAENLVVSGHLWDENREQWAFKPAVMVQAHGSGHVIGFVGDPSFRAYMDGLSVLFASAVFRAPAYAGY